MTWPWVILVWIGMIFVCLFVAWRWESYDQDVHRDWSRPPRIPAAGDKALKAVEKFNAWMDEMWDSLR